MALAASDRGDGGPGGNVGAAGPAGGPQRAAATPASTAHCSLPRRCRCMSNCVALNLHLLKATSEHPCGLLPTLKLDARWFGLCLRQSSCAFDSHHRRLPAMLQVSFGGKTIVLNSLRQEAVVAADLVFTWRQHCIGGDSAQFVRPFPNGICALLCLNSMLSSRSDALSSRLATPPAMQSTARGGAKLNLPGAGYSEDTEVMAQLRQLTTPEVMAAFLQGTLPDMKRQQLSQRRKRPNELQALVGEQQTAEAERKGQRQQEQQEPEHRHLRRLVAQGESHQAGLQPPAVGSRKRKQKPRERVPQAQQAPAADDEMAPTPVQSKAPACHIRRKHPGSELEGVQAAGQGAAAAAPALAVPPQQRQQPRQQQQQQRQPMPPPPPPPPPQQQQHGAAFAARHAHFAQSALRRAVDALGAADVTDPDSMLRPLRLLVLLGHGRQFIEVRYSPCAGPLPDSTGLTGLVPWLCRQSGPYCLPEPTHVPPTHPTHLTHPTHFPFPTLAIHHQQHRML